MESPISMRELIVKHGEAYRAGALPMYTITQNPKDYPGKFVVSMRLCSAAGEKIGPVVAVEDTLLRARMAIAPLSLHRQPRHPTDPPVIVETWF